LLDTPKGRLNRLEAALVARAWHIARPEVRVKLLPEDGDLYVYVESQARIGKERSMRRKRFKRYWARLKELQRQRPSYSTLLMKLGAAAHDAGRTRALVKLTLPEAPPKGEREKRVDFTFALDRAALKKVRRREGRYLLRSNLTDTDPAKLWEFYLQLSEIETAFKELKGDLAIRPIHHQNEQRIEAHIFVAFIAYCLQVTLKQLLKQRAPGLTPRVVLEKLAAMQLLDVHFPTTDGRELLFTRYTQPQPDQQLLLAQLGWGLPEQARPRITAKSTVAV
jgi:IS4 transposase